MLEIFEEFWKHRNTMLEDAIKKADELVEILRKTEEADNSKRMDLLDHIKACFSGGRWLTKSVNTKAAAHIKELLTMYVQLNLGEVSKVKSLVDNFLLNPGSIMRVRDPTPRPNCDPFLVTVTCIVDPGEFYVVRWCDEGKRDRLQRSFEKEALNYLKPEEIITGQMYAVLSKDTKWYRGICGQQCGIYQVGDSLPEKLYSFSFVDDGRQETIRSALIRCLPDELVVIPAMALQCTLNHNFKRIPFNGEATARFKQATRRSPMSMKIFSQDGGILNVDLSQIPCFGEDNYYVSIRDALFLDHFIRAAPVTTVELPLRKFKAKYGLADINCKRGETLRVKISDALNPANVYVNVLDEDWLLFAEVHRSLQEEFADNQTDIPHEVYKGICWYVQLVKEFPQMSFRLHLCCQVCWRMASSSY